MSSKDLDSQLVSIITKARQEYSRSWTKLTEEEFISKQILKTEFVPPNEAEWQDVPNLYFSKRCSNCHRFVYYDYYKHEENTKCPYKYCPFCGSLMRGEYI